MSDHSGSPASVTVVVRPHASPPAQAHVDHDQAVLTSGLPNTGHELCAFGRGFVSAIAGAGVAGGLVFAY